MKTPIHSLITLLCTATATTERKERNLMNPLIQLNRQLQYLFIALLLGCFAITARADIGVGRELPNKPPNHPVYPVRGKQFVPCAGETVPLSGQLRLHFESVNQVAKPKSAVLEGVTGIGESSGRTYVANNDPSSSKFQVISEGPNKKTHISWILEFQVVGNPNPPPRGDVCPGCVNRFTLKFTVESESRSPGKVFAAAVKTQVLCP